MGASSSVIMICCLQEQLERKAASAPERRLLRGLYHTEGPNLPATKTVIGSSCFCASNFAQEN